MRLLASIVASAVLLIGCARSHTRPGDGLPGHDGGGAAETGAGGGSSSEGVPCGPNTCYDGEVCCRPSCGLCTDPGVCIPSLPCRGFGTVCGGVLCAETAAFCCSTCEGEVCPGPGIGSRAECPPVSCE